MVVILQISLTTSSCLALRVRVRAGLEANYVSHHHQTLDLTRTNSSLAAILSLALNLQGMQNDCDMVPLMVQSNFKPKGWLGLILGTRLWCKFFLYMACRSAFELANMV